MQVSIKDSFVTVPQQSILNYDSVYTGIYSITDNSINKTFGIKINGVAYFTTYYSVGMGYRGYLYAFDLKSKRLLTNQSTNENYIFSSAGIFFLNKEHLFSVSTPNHENAEDPFNTVVEIYKINKDRFRYVKYIKLNGEMTVDDTSIIKLYNKVVK